MKTESPSYATIRVPLLDFLVAVFPKIIDHPEMIDFTGLGLPPDAKLNGDFTLHPPDLFLHDVSLDFLVDGKDGRDLSNYGDSRLVLDTPGTVPVFKSKYVEPVRPPVEINT